MIYVALAAVAVLAFAVWAAWDFGRRCLAVNAANDVHRSRLDEVVGDVARLSDELGERLDDVPDRIKYAIAEHARQKLSEDERYARAVCERMDKFEARLSKLETSYGDSHTVLNLRTQTNAEKVAKLEELVHERGVCIGELQEAVNGAEIRINELAGKSAEPVDVAEFKEALAELQAKYDTQHAAFANFWTQIGKQFATKDELATEFAKLKSGQAVMSATNGPRFKAGVRPT